MASTLASTEPVMATLMGVLVYKEGLPLMLVLGVLLVIGAIVVLNLKRPL
jgi:drug/metabolite transporter (DMT)-like permease